MHVLMQPAFRGIVPSVGLSNRTAVSEAGLRFGRGAGPVFITPMVVENVPPFDPNNMETVQTYLDLMEKAKSQARPDVTGRKVGTVAIGESGRAYLGANFEVKVGEASWTIHAEPFALALARKYGERRITHMVQSLQPCAACRQVVRELGYEDLPMTFVQQDARQKPGEKPDPALMSFTRETIGNLFPNGYSYATPRLNLLNHPVLNLDQRFELPKSKDPLTQIAVETANRSYVPNKRETWAGMAVRLKDGSVYSGDTITISGPNPTIVPVMTLLAKLIGDGRSPDEIDRAVLVEPDNADYSYFTSTRGVLEQVAPQTRLKRVRLRKTDG